MNSSKLYSARTRLLPIALFLFFSWSCGTESESDGQSSSVLSQDTTTAPIQEDSVSTDSVATAPVIPTPILDTLASGDVAAVYLDSFKAKLARPELISSDEDIMLLVRQRDSLINMLQYKILEPFYYDRLTQADDPEQMREDMRLELEALGLVPVFSEGMYIALAEGPLLAERIEEVASESLQLYLYFQQQYAASLGSEYTYIDLAPEMEMVKTGGKLLREYPDSRYVPMIQSAYDEALIALTDFHLLKRNSTQTVIGGIEVDFYPTASSLENQRSFLENYPDEPLAPVIGKLLENPSVINLTLNDTLHLLSMGSFVDMSEARSQALSALQEGRDIPHVIEAKGQRGKSYLWVYRFYSDYQQADSVYREQQPNYQGLTWREGLVTGGGLILIDSMATM